MTDLSHTDQTSDICLLLRAHGEQRWLIYEVVPVVRQLEQADSLPEDQLGAAFAYLEALWIEARIRAAETDAAFAELEPPRAGEENTMHEKALRYYTAVGRLRDALGRRALSLLISTEEAPEGAATSANGEIYANGGMSANGHGASGEMLAREPIVDRSASS